jgi:hypothetical protein
VPAVLTKIVGVKSLDPPSFDGWQVWCETCSAAVEVDAMKERDAGSCEVYYDYVCRQCHSIVINVARANPDEREKRSPGTSLN